MKDRDRAQALIDQHEQVTSGTAFVDYVNKSCTEAPYFAQRLLDALDVIRAYESECLCRLNGEGRCDRCVNARQFLEGSESHG